MKTLTRLAPAKINLSLEVLRKRPDGFHEVRMLMASIGLCDRLTFRTASDLRLECDQPGLSVGEDNLVMKAGRLLQAVCPRARSRGARIILKKQIPLAAGLAGGSTDAAATLLGLNQLWHLGLKRAQLHRLAERLGSDVPFCLERGFAVATGRGERLKRIKLKPPKVWILLAKPPIGISTPWAYKNCRPNDPGFDRTSKVFFYFRTKNFKKMTFFSKNDLEIASVGHFPEILKLKEWMTGGGAVFSKMSGSGPTVFGLFENKKEAEKTKKSIKNSKFFKKITTFY
jgi:4-diphosphocytidyl-2-C-methyl-D-erythritol kinase